ncbi:DUF4864 domain-containing protein [Pseudohoeflea coraliihabitans]|uniref:DUF4864 domain-containing protein n=1 Tax=Pseudohoeflea coraliihabitans TaxID=2860393 RepID=A0ABS6WQK9_9HYPH|nr:DUF4864 domain-containing protein [Pseudohoeflea sp. DP4N28-3]MBW3098251.1 DUF4864 domain-containing protein [Pseudohoeflea sp. DP4N28-3]
MRAFCAVILLTLSAAAGGITLGPAAAQETGKSAVELAREVIDGQIQAFLEDDIATAYSFAAPDIKAIYPTEEQFGAMVRKGYGPVFRPGNYAFGRAQEAGDGSIIQEVLISAPDGKDWTALYVMQPQPDGSLKIRGVHMLPSAPTGI